MGNKFESIHHPRKPLGAKGADAVIGMTMDLARQGGAQIDKIEDLGITSSGKLRQTTAAAVDIRDRARGSFSHLSQTILAMNGSHEIAANGYGSTNLVDTKGNSLLSNGDLSVVENNNHALLNGMGDLITNSTENGHTKTIKRKKNQPENRAIPPRAEWAQREPDLSVRVQMLEDENIGNVEMFKDLLDHYFGPMWPAVAYYANMDTQYAAKRELRRKNAELDKAIEAGATLNELDSLEDKYKTKRDEEIKRQRRRANISVKRWFDKTISEDFSLTGETPEKFADRQHIHANAAVNYLGDILVPDFPSVVAILNEAELSFESPVDVIEFMASNNTDQKLKRHIQRNMVLQYISAVLESREINPQSGKKLSRIHKLFNRDLFDGKDGETYLTWITSYHDNSTKDVVGYHVAGDKSDKKFPPGTTHKMSTPLRFRYLQGFDFPVLTNPDRKNQDSAIIKSVKKAKARLVSGRGDGTLMPTEDVQDTHRLRMTVMGEEEEALALYNELSELLIAESSQEILVDKDDGLDPVFEAPDYDMDGNPILDTDGNPIVTEMISYPVREFVDGEPVVRLVTKEVTRKKYKGRIMKIEDDPSNNPENGFTKGAEFNRLQIFSSDSDTSVECIVMDMRQYLRYEYHVGDITKDSEGNYSINGVGHFNYEHDRSASVMQVIYSKSEGEAVNGPEINLQQAANKALLNKARKLKNQRLGRSR